MIGLGARGSLLILTALSLWPRPEREAGQGLVCRDLRQDESPWCHGQPSQLKETLVGYLEGVVWSCGLLVSFRPRAKLAWKLGSLLSICKKTLSSADLGQVK